MLFDSMFSVVKNQHIFINSFIVIQFMWGAPCALRNFLCLFFLIGLDCQTPHWPLSLPPVQLLQLPGLLPRPVLSVDHLGTGSTGRCVSNHILISLYDILLLFRHDAIAHRHPYNIPWILIHRLELSEIFMTRIEFIGAELRYLPFYYCELHFLQAHKQLHGGVMDKEKGMRGYYVIMAVFIVLTFILSLAGANNSAPFFSAVTYTPVYVCAHSFSHKIRRFKQNIYAFLVHMGRSSFFSKPWDSSFSSPSSVVSVRCTTFAAISVRFVRYTSLVIVTLIRAWRSSPFHMSSLLLVLDYNTCLARHWCISRHCCLWNWQSICCRCCSDGCCDVLKVACCSCCTTFQLGNHLFDYRNNTEITYEATPVVELVWDHQSTWVWTLKLALNVTWISVDYHELELHLKGLAEFNTHSSDQEHVRLNCLLLQLGSR